VVPGATSRWQYIGLSYLFHYIKVGTGLGSRYVIVIYNCREESDVDGELAGRLYDRVEGLEKQDLINSIKFNEENGMDTTDLKQRLRVVLEKESRA
jgi:hypothetical protein